jgi:hypothetical protein
VVAAPAISTPARIASIFLIRILLIRVVRAERSIRP